MAYQITVNTGQGGNIVSTSVSQVATSVVVSNQDLAMLVVEEDLDLHQVIQVVKTIHSTTLGASTDVDISEDIMVVCWYGMLEH